MFGEDEKEIKHLAENDLGAVHKDDGMIQLEIWSKDIVLFLSPEEWDDFKKLMWEAMSNDTKR